MCTCGDEGMRNRILVDPTVRILELFELQLGSKVELGWSNSWALLLLLWWPLLLPLWWCSGFPMMTIRRLSSSWAGNGYAVPLLRLLRG